MIRALRLPRPSALLLLLAVAAFGATTCRGRHVPTQAKRIYILNLTDTPIQSIRYERCETPGSGYTPIPADRPIEPHERLAIAPIPGCVNLKALDIEGDVVGLQRDLHMKPGMVWRIQ